MPFNSVINRADTGGALIPEPVANQIIQEAPKASVILERARRVPMSSKTLKQPVLATLPEAYWVNGDTGLKQTTKAAWDNVVMTAEEVAALVPIPDAVIADSGIPLWDQVRPLLVEAVGQLVDLAAVFGIGKPASWPTAIVPGAIAAGNTVAAGTGVDYGQDVALLAQKVAQDGFSVNGFAAKPGLQWQLVGLRSPQGVPIYTPSLSAGTPAGLYGYPLNEVLNGSWQDATAELIAADWTKFVVGIRQDITFKMLDQAVITDETGKVIFNAPQQDSQIMRVVFRVGYQVANPLTRVNPTAGTRFPAGVLTPEVP
jgi:HK97 family phage major capsid protein